MPSKRIFILAVCILFPLSCRGKNCGLSLNTTPTQGGNFSVSQWKAVKFSALGHPCDRKAGVTYRWNLNGEDVSFSDSYTFYACGSAMGKTNILKAVAKDTKGNETDVRWAITVKPAPQPSRPADVQTAIGDVKQGGIFGVPTAYTQMITTTTIAESEASYTSAVSTIEPYLQENACDLDATYAYALAKLVLLGDQAQGFVTDSRNLTTENVKSLYDNSVAPIVEKYTLLKREAGSDFLFPIMAPLRIGVFNNLPQGRTDLMEITVNLSGEHGLPEIYMFVTLANAVAGAMESGLAFTRIIDFAGMVPQTFDLDTYEHIFLQTLKDDPDFLTLSGPDGSEGKAHLLTAQFALATALRTFTQTIDIMMKETNGTSSDPRYHVFRFWDCGADGVCPAQPVSENNTLANAAAPFGDPCEPYKVGSYPTWYTSTEKGGRCDAGGCNPIYSCDNPTAGEGYQSGYTYTDTNNNGSWNKSRQATGTDGGEGNGKFDSGEPLGTELVMELGLRGIALPTQTGIKKAMVLVAKNIEGPDPLDLDSIVGYAISGNPLPKGTIKWMMGQFRVPYPEIRLSEYFTTPTAPRDLIPLYDCAALSVIVQSEEEYCQNPRVSYVINGCPNDVGSDGCVDPYENPAGGCLTSPTSSGDPHNDDWSPFSNPNGTELNYMWDPGEPFSDTGVWDGKEFASGTVGNGREDSIDIPHYWPSGSNVCGPMATTSVDFRNSTPADLSAKPPSPSSPCIDEFYLFFPDPTFSGVLVFPDPITNTDNLPLNANAKLHRFECTALQAVRTFGKIGLPAIP